MSEALVIPIYHVLILARVVPYSMSCGGKLKHLVEVRSLKRLAVDKQALKMIGWP